MRTARIFAAAATALLLSLAAGSGRASGRASRPPAPGRVARVDGTRITIPLGTVPHEVYAWPRFLKQGWAARLNPAGRVARVFYPLAGADVTSAFAMFDGPHGGPDELLLTDRAPFGSPRRVAAQHGDAAAKASFYRDKGQHAYSWLGKIDALGRDGGLGAAVLWELEALGADDVQLEYLSAAGAPGAWREAGRDVVRVRFAIDGRARTLLYVQHDVTRPHVPRVITSFLDRGIDAYFEKAAYGPYLGDGYLALRARAIGGLRGRDGIYVSDHGFSEAAREGLVPAGKIPAYGHANSGQPVGDATARRADLPFYRAPRAPAVRE